MLRVDKAFAYVTSRRGLLVFTHADFPEAGVQVPAGTILAGERPETAVLREVHEETGLSGFSTPTFLGVSEFDARPFGKPQWHRRHFFHLPFAGEAPERWQHYERDASDGGQAPIALDLFWLRLPEAAACLIADHGALLGALSG